MVALNTSDSDARRMERIGELLARLDWHHIKPFYLSADSPDFNPIERLWQHLKGGPMAGFLTNDGEALSNRLLGSLKGLLDDSKLEQSVCDLPSFNRK